MTGLAVCGIHATPRNMGRFLSPDPSGLLEAKPANPQSWNLYTYELNNPLSNLDPTGLDCVYANDAGNSVESIDHDSDSDECGSNGGYWVDGTFTSGTTYANNNDVYLHGYLQMNRLAEVRAIA